MSNMTKDLIESLADGAKFDAETFADFKNRLHHDCVGAGVRNHLTDAPLFTVQSLEIVHGFEIDPCGNTMVYYDESTWFNPEDYWDDADEDRQKEINDLAQALSVDFLDLDIWEQWNILDALPDHDVSGWKEEWVHVNSHLTKDAAEAFIERKNHDYRKLRVWVSSQYWAWEFKAITKAILSGQLVYCEKGIEAEQEPEPEPEGEPAQTWVLWLNKRKRWGLALGRVS